MISVANRIYVNPEYYDQFEARFRERAGLVDGMPGFLANHVLRPTKEGEPFVVLTFWESRAAFEAWTNSDALPSGPRPLGQLAEGRLHRPQRP